MRSITLITIVAGATALTSCSRLADKDHIYLACAVTPTEGGHPTADVPVTIYERITPKTNAIDKLERGLHWEGPCGKVAVCSRSGLVYRAKINANGDVGGDIKIDLQAGTIQYSDQTGPTVSGVCKPTSNPLKPKDKGWTFGLFS